jgi:hypothetical protein
MLPALTIDYLEWMAMFKYVTRTLGEDIHSRVHSTRSALMLSQHRHFNILQYKSTRHTHSSLLSSSPSDRLEAFLGVAALCM